jgi:uncharacterized protein YecT (DUF1311 family)
MRKFTAFIILFLFTLADCLSQGHIEHIKNQEYLKTKVDCANLEGDSFSGRVCANLAFQKSDSLLVVIYDSLILATEKEDKVKRNIIKLQSTWRKFRDQHCALIYDKYEGCQACNQQAIDYLDCLRGLTEQRINHLIKLKSELGY